MSVSDQAYHLKYKHQHNPILLTIAIFAVAVVLFMVFAYVWTDWLWFKSLNMSVIFTTQLAARIGLFVVFGLVMGLSVWVSLWIAYRLRPPTRSTKPTSLIFERFQELLDTKRNYLICVPAIVLGLLAGISAAAQPEQILMWLNATPFGSRDKYFGFDIGFFVFELPWWSLLTNFLLIVTVISFVAAIFVHFITGSISVNKLRRKVGPKPYSASTAHLSINMGILFVIFGISILLDRIGLSLDTGSQSAGAKFTGIHYTAMHSRMSAMLILAIITFICGALFFANAWFQHWRIPNISVVLLIISGLILGIIYPWWMQTVDVNPNEADKEHPFIAENLRATRKAFGIDHIEIQDYRAVATASAGQLKADAEALPAIRLMDPAVIAPAFEQLQQVRGYYSFPKVLDVDRYTLNKTPTDAVVAVRELNIDGIKEANWNNIHTVYTHGYGLVAAYGNKRLGNGEPQFIEGGIPTEGLLKESQPRVYFGEKIKHYAVVGAPTNVTPVELDTPGGGKGRTETRFTYNGKGGVPIGGFFNRLLYSIRFADINLMLTDRVNRESKILYDRTPQERAQKAAPWLTFDSDAYPSLVDGRIVWILDAFTTTSNYPNSTKIDWDRSISELTNPPSTILPKRVNYIRNSVKAVVDAYDGSVKLYSWDESDPILQTWQKVYPGTVLPKSKISEDLRKHLRYPQDLFKVQREVLGRYHTTNAFTWFQRSDVWQVPADPKATSEKEPPYFLTIKWPKGTKAHFSQTSIFVPLGRANLSVYLAVNSDATSKDYGRLRALKLPDSAQVAGPAQTFNALSNDPKVAERLLPFTRQGNTRTIYGNLLTLPVGGGLLYVQPIYTQIENVEGAYPSMRFVAVRFGEHVGIGSTLQQALDQVFQGNSGASTGENPVTDIPATSTPTPTPAPTPATANSGKTPSPSVSSSPQPATGKQAIAKGLLNEAEKLFAEADEALKAGDLAKYQAKIAAAKAKVVEAMKSLD